LWFFEFAIVIVNIGDRKPLSRAHMECTSCGIESLNSGNGLTPRGDKVSIPNVSIFPEHSKNAI
jgi:hypothetical protein